MADITTPAAPQSFTFGTQQLSGVLVSFSGQSQRRGAAHKFLKRAGAVMEDMNAEQRRLEVELTFIGAGAARDFNAFEAAVRDNPIQLLVHPIAGRFQAFCEGPQSAVNFAHALNEIRVRVSFLESELDAGAPDTPDVPTAAQNVSAEQTAYQKVVAAYTGALAYASTTVASARAAILNTIDQIDTFTDPVTSVVTAVVQLPGVASSVVGALQSIQVINSILDQLITDYTTATSDLFSGALIAAGSADAVTNLLGTVRETSDSLEALLESSSPTPAGAAEAVGSLEECVAACLVLSDAVAAARPATIVITVPRLIDLMTLCQLRYPAIAQQRVLDVLSLNTILNPAAIPAGTRLVVPIN